MWLVLIQSCMIYNYLHLDYLNILFVDVFVKIIRVLKDLIEDVMKMKRYCLLFLRYLGLFCLLTRYKMCWLLYIYRTRRFYFNSRSCKQLTISAILKCFTSVFNIHSMHTCNTIQKYKYWNYIHLFDILTRERYVLKTRNELKNKDFQSKH